MMRWVSFFGPIMALVATGAYAYQLGASVRVASAFSSASILYACIWFVWTTQRALSSKPPTDPRPRSRPK